MVDEVDVRVIRVPRSFAGRIDAETISQGLDVVAATLLNNNQLRFQAERGPNGQPWRRSARAQRDGGRTLFDTSSLFRSIQIFSPSRDTRIITVDPTATNRRTGVPVLRYARAHQLGLGNNPVRRFLGIANADRTDGARVFRAHIRNALNQ